MSAPQDREASLLKHTRMAFSYVFCNSHSWLLIIFDTTGTMLRKTSLNKQRIGIHHLTCHYYIWSRWSRWRGFSLHNIIIIIITIYYSPICYMFRSCDHLQVENIYRDLIVSSLKAVELQDLAKNKLRGFSSRANYTDRATAACRRS
jgi:hypothetical protein